MANEFARNLRKNATPAERALWRCLRDKSAHGFRFRRQHPLGRYVADFVCLERRALIELEGGHHTDGDQAAHDVERDRLLRAQGYSILRFWNADVLRDPAAIAWQIIHTLNQSDRPRPPPETAAQFRPPR